MSFGAGDITGTGNPYPRLFVESLPRGVLVVPFTWKAAITGQYDVFHVHWPEHLLAGSGPIWLRNRLFFLLLLGRLAVRRTPVVRTVHNHEPHADVGFAGRCLLRMLDVMTSSRIVMNRVDQDPVLRNVHYVPHGHYRSTVRDGLIRPRGASMARLLYFGTIFPYKGVDLLVQEFASSDSGLELSVVGAVKPQGLSWSSRSLLEGDPRLSASLSHVNEEELHLAIAECDVVVLPYEKFTNSGSLLLALSLNRPVVVPSFPGTDELQAEFGSHWVATYDPPFSMAKLRDCIAALSLHSESELNMGGRDWHAIGRSVGELYRETLHARGAR